MTSDVDPLACLFIDVGTMPAEVNGLATVALVGRHELDAAVVVPVVVPVHK